MRTLAKVAIAVLLTVTAVSAQGNAALSNDAMSGADAPGSSDAALPIAWGGYAGYAWRDDADWYAPPEAPAVSCVEFVASGSNGIATLVAGAEGAQQSASGSFIGSTARLSLAVQDAAPILASVVGNTRANEAGDYTFTITSVTGGSGDANTGLDAADTLGAAMPVSDGCIGGRVGAGDVGDYFTFDVPAGMEVTVSAASLGDVSVDLKTAAGDTLATLAPGEIVTLTTLPAGSYSLSASSMSLETLPYAMSLSVLAPPCRPNC